MSKERHDAIQAELDGIVGDRHRSWVRRSWQGDKQPAGSQRRNERQWSAVSVEELAGITAAMDLDEPLLPATLGANLCIEGIPELSRLPKGTLLRFPSGAELMVEEYNPPCHDMAKRVAALHRTRPGKAPGSTAFSQAAKLTRGIVGVVEAAGPIVTGDTVVVEVYEHPAWLARTGDVP